jgi:hypothetical protein
MKDLGKLKGNEMMVVLDADHDGQVNDAIIEYGQTRRVFSRMKDGTIVERLNLPDFQADLDGDRKDDAVYLVRQAEMRIRCSSGCKASLKLPPYTFIAVADIDGDKVAEIVGVEGVITDRRLYCWYCKNGKWHRSLTLKFSQMNWTVLGGDVRFRDVSLSGFPSETAAMLFRDEKGVYLLAVTEESGQVKIWGVRWRKGKWTKHLMGEVPEPDTIWVRIVRVGQEWLVFCGTDEPFWQWLLWSLGEKIKPLQPFWLSPPKSCFFVYSWDGQRKWDLLKRWKGYFPKDIELADMDGDGKWELTIAFPERVLVAKFEDGRWRTGWVEVPFVEYDPIGGFYGFRYGGREWALYQDINSHRCVAIALEGQK